MKRNKYQTAISQLRVSNDFQEKTCQRLLLEMERKEMGKNRRRHINMESTMKKTRRMRTWGIGLTACVLLTVGALSLSGNLNFIGNQGVNPGNEPPIIQGAMAVNIDGIISEVSEDGKSFKVEDLWVTVTEDTQYGATGPNDLPPDEQLLEKEFKVGNAVSGYTTQDITTGKVTADIIYNNFAPRN